MKHLVLITLVICMIEYLLKKTVAMETYCTKNQSLAESTEKCHKEKNESPGVPVLPNGLQQAASLGYG